MDLDLTAFLAQLVTFEAVSLALITTVLMEGIKKILDLAWKDRAANATAGVKWFNTVGMPAIHLSLAFALGIAWPFRPPLVADGTWYEQGAWGFFIGGIVGFWIYKTVKSVFELRKARE